MNPKDRTNIIDIFEDEDIQVKECPPFYSNLFKKIKNSKYTDIFVLEIDKYSTDHPFVDIFPLNENKLTIPWTIWGKFSFNIRSSSAKFLKYLTDTNDILGRIKFLTEYELISYSNRENYRTNGDHHQYVKLIFGKNDTEVRQWIEKFLKS